MRPVYALGLAACCLLLAGCGGEKHVELTGALRYGDQPVKPNDNEEVHISFVAMKAEAPIQHGTGEFDAANGTFVLHSPVRHGIPPGEYRIVVRCTPYQEDEPDRFGGVFGEETSPLVYTVTDERSQEIVIDLKARSVTRK